MHCGSECFCQLILQLILIGQYLHSGLSDWLSVAGALLAAPSNLPIQVLILPGLSPVQCSVHQLSLIILMESQLK